jgi:hypothetical protein
MLVTWPPRSPCLIPRDFFFGYISDTVYVLPLDTSLLEFTGMTRAAFAFPDNVWTKTEIRYTTYLLGHSRYPQLSPLYCRAQKVDHITYSGGLHFNLRAFWFTISVRIKWYKFHVHNLCKDATEGVMVLSQNGLSHRKLVYVYVCVWLVFGRYELRISARKPAILS